MRLLSNLLLSAFLVTFLGVLPGIGTGGGLVVLATAQEHPGSGSKAQADESGSASREHPEHPGSAAKEEMAVERPPVTIESVAVYLEGYVAAKAKAADGWYRIEDEKAGETLRLRLDHIHRDRLAKTADKTWFVCADFKTPKGKIYDLDFWVHDTDHGLAVTESMVHKEAGKARYSWVEKDGVWSRKPLD